jgi:hypothetical protein
MYRIVRSDLRGVLPTLIIVAALSAAACSDSVAPATGTLVLSVSTTGPAPDADGYVLRVDTSGAQRISVDGNLTVSGVPPGTHAVLLSDVAANCTVGGSDPQQVTVTGGDTARVGFAVACSAVGTIGDVGGVWDWTEHFDDPAAGVTCDDTGSYVFVVDTAGFSGTSDQVGTCTGPSGVFDNTLRGIPVTAGSVTAGLMQFTVGYWEECRYEAALSASPDHVVGTAECGTSPGTWTADRGLPLSALTVAPSATTLPVNAVFPLTADLRNSLGNRVFDRPVAWSSDDPTVVGVDALGQAGAIQPGKAHLQASAEGVAAQATITVGGAIDTDAVGDTFGSSLDPQIDILSLSAAVDSSDLTVAVRLVGPPSGGVYGYLDLDVDQNPSTGAGALVDAWRPDSGGSSGLGDEFVCDLSSGDLYDAVTGDWMGTMPRFYDGVTNTIVVRFPVSTLGSQQANLAVVIGNYTEPTDLAPNEGHLTLGVAGTSPVPVAATALRSVSRPWHSTARLTAPGRRKIP